MTKFETLLYVSDKQKEEVLKAIDLTLNDFEDLTKKLHEFIDKSEHLPKSYDTALIPGAILNNKGNLQAAKQFIENFYRIKSVYAEILYDHCIPGSKMFKESSKASINVCSQKLTPENYRIHYLKFSDPEGKVQSPFAYLLTSVMLFQIRCVMDFSLSTVVVCDMKDSTYKSMMKYTLQYIYLIKDILHSIHFRIQAMHFVNGPNIIEKFLNLMKGSFPEKLRNRLHIHKDMESLQKVIPKECLLKDYGGTEKSLEELHYEWIEAMTEMEPFYKKMIAAKSTKKYELDEFTQQSLGLGVEGTFKMLQID